MCSFTFRKIVALLNHNDQWHSVEMTRVINPIFFYSRQNYQLKGRGNDLAVESTSHNPKGPGLSLRLGSCRSSLIS